MLGPRILIVGHGYLGAFLAGFLHRQGISVAALHRGPATLDLYPIFSGDVTFRESLAAITPSQKPDLIVHCASSGRGGVESYRAVFVTGIQNLQSVFPDVPVIFTSSTSVYGQTDGSRVDESSEVRPDRETGRILLEAEQLTRSGGGIALRLAGIYGPGRSVHLRRLLEGTATIEDVTPSRYLNQIHRDDAAGAISHLIRGDGRLHRGGLYNVVDDITLTQRACYEALAEQLGRPIPPLAPPDPDRKRGWTHKLVSNSALRATGWAPTYPSFLDAVRDDPRLVRSIRESLESDG